jgi:hypothetical protein
MAYLEIQVVGVCVTRTESFYAILAAATEATAPSNHSTIGQQCSSAVVRSTIHMLGIK